MEIPGYNVIREIGKGGMAAVYLARQESLERHVALKVLDETNLGGKVEDLAERFIAEGRILASLSHPNIITIFDIGVTSTNLFYISMEYVEGGDLKELMELPVSAAQCLNYLHKISSALDEAHRHGIVHCDVKPANILFRDDDNPILTDFGIAKQIDNETDLTSAGIFFGSPNYVSPEQVDGMQIDGRADIYSLGCVFYELLTGTKPYLSDSITGIVKKHKHDPVPTLPPEHKEFQSLLDGMMAKNRNKRIPDAATLLEKIQKLEKSQNKVMSHLDMTVADPGFVEANLRARLAKKILGGLILLGLVLFSSLKYVEIKLKSEKPIANAASTKTVVAAPVIIPTAKTTQTDAIADTNHTEKAEADIPQQAEPGPAIEEVTKALQWLGKQSLAEFKLTFPPKDNAYYYFTRLLDIDPGNAEAINGIYQIADRYAVLAEQALANNEQQKSLSYIDIGLRINPKNETLLSMKPLVQNSTLPSLLDTLKGFF